MSTHHPYDEWATPHEDQALSGLFRAHGTTGSEGAAEMLEGALGPMRSRVRRRRAAKAAATGAGTLALTGIVALGATQAFGTQGEDATLPGNPSPSYSVTDDGPTAPAPAGTPSGHASGHASGEPSDLAIGSQPLGWGATDYTCGMPWEEVGGNGSPMSLELTADFAPADFGQGPVTGVWTAPAELDSGGLGTDGLHVASSPVLVWGQGGRAVAFGRYTAPDGRTPEEIEAFAGGFDAGGKLGVVLDTAVAATCTVGFDSGLYGGDGDLGRAPKLPAGTYDVVALLPVADAQQPDNGTGTPSAFSEPFQVRVAEDGTPSVVGGPAATVN